MTHPVLPGLLRALVAVLLACATAAPASGQPPPPRSVEGVVTHVTDGDSLWVTPPGQRGIEVRLRDIDAPEICQVWGEEARRALEALVLGRSVVLRITGRDPHGRTLGDVAVDGVDVGRRMVEDGHAWSIRTRWDRGPLVKEERMADALRRGLHGQPGAVMPRDFRRGHGPCFAAPAADRAPGTAAPPVAGTAPPATAPRPLPAATHPRCDGRTRCSQMSSCDEARYFLQHCPGVEMDGDGDGTPCETQWCR
jgi:endonuclease YncB( thermonuclease family)